LTLVPGNPGVPVASAGEQETLEVGAGFFGLALPAESLRIYYGARASYVGIKTVLRFGGPLFPSRYEDKTSGYRIAPTFGFEYLFNRHFTLGGEIAYAYQNLDSDDSTEFRASRFESERTGTESFLVLRYFF
jgi:hypothetical protein